MLQNEDNSVTLHNISSDEDTDKENSCSLRNENSSGSSIYRKLQRPSVKDILNLTTHGRAILKSHKNYKTLNRKCRNIIVDLILSELLNHVDG